MFCTCGPGPTAAEKKLKQLAELLDRPIWHPFWGVLVGNQGATTHLPTFPFGETDTHFVTLLGPASSHSQVHGSRRLRILRNARRFPVVRDHLAHLREVDPQKRATSAEACELEVFKAVPGSNNAGTN